MDIHSEIEIYKFLQLINDNDKSDEGTVLFVKHLFAMNKLEYIKAIYGQEIIIRHNEDIPYLVALENALENFAEHFNMFIKDLPGKEKPTEEARDVEADSKRLMQELDNIIASNISSSLPSTFQSIVPHLYTANKCLDKLRAYKYESGISTNIKDAMEFFTHLQDIHLNNGRGLYFYLK